MENSVRGKDMETTRDKVIRMILEEMDSKIAKQEHDCKLARKIS